MIVKHGDLGPWNTVWQGTELAGVIDWDFAEPGEGLEDAAQMAWYSIPLRSRSQCRRCGFETIPDLRTRLRLFCEAYGTTPDALIASLLEVQENEMERIRRYGEQSIPPWDSFHDRGDVAEIKKEQAWLIKNQRLLI